MKLWTVASACGVGIAVGCSSSPNPPPVGQPPPAPTTMTTAPSSKIETFAVQTLFLGETDRTGSTGTPNPWKTYGYNLDGLVTTETSTNVCTLAANAPTLNQVDGNSGIDNAFGSIILPIIENTGSPLTPSAEISQEIDKGEFTILIQVTGLDDTPAQSSTGLAGQVFGGGAYPGGMPAFTSATDWPVAPQLLNDYQNGMCPPSGCVVSSGSQVQFPAGYMTGGTFVSGNLEAGGVTLALTLDFEGVTMTLPLNHAVISFDHTTPTTATNGTIAGVIDTMQLINGLKSAAGRISTSLCGPAFDGLAQQIMQASDILADGSNMAGVPCTGISFGIGFTAVLVANPDMVASVPAVVPPDPCASSDAGEQ
jgi:hypothetical protein